MNDTVEAGNPSDPGVCLLSELEEQKQEKCTRVRGNFHGLNSASS